MFNIVLVEPEIPQNTGNIARTCAATGGRLHLVRPLGFEISDRYLKRAGLDYWHLLEIFYYDSFAELEAKFPNSRFFYFTTKGRTRHSDASFRDGDFSRIRQGDERTSRGAAFKTSRRMSEDSDVFRGPFIEFEQFGGRSGIRGASSDGLSRAYGQRGASRASLDRGRKIKCIREGINYFKAVNNFRIKKGADEFSAL